MKGAVRTASVAIAMALAMATGFAATGADASAIVFIHPVPSANRGAGPNVLNGVTALSATDAWAVGSSAPSATGATAALGEHFNGQAWKLSGIPTPPHSAAVLTAVAGSGSRDVWAVGYQFSNTHGGIPLTEHWNGSAWAVVPSPSKMASGFLLGVAAPAPTDAWAVGFWDDLNGFPNVLVEHWNGTAWSIEPAPQTADLINQLNAIVALSPSNIWAVGDGQDPEGGPSQTLIEHFDGSAWKIVPSPVGASQVLSGVAAVSPIDLWAAGSQSPTGSSASSGLIEHWDGHRWSVVSSPGVTGSSVTLTGISVDAVTDAWAVGWSQASFSSPRHIVAERWDGVRWSVVPASGVGSSDSALSASTLTAGGQLWAVGSRASTSGLARTLIVANCPACA